MSQAETTPEPRKVVIPLPVLERRNVQGLNVAKSGSELADPVDTGSTKAASLNRRKAKARKNLILPISFAAVVIVPALLVAIYMYLFAADQYASQVSFAVRSNSAPTASAFLGLLGKSGGESTTTDSYIVLDYLQSDDFVSKLLSQHDFKSIYNHENADSLFRLGDKSFREDVADYWSWMHSAEYDPVSSVIYVEVRAFTPEHALQLSKVVESESQALVNRLSERGRAEQIKSASREVASAEVRVKMLQKQMLALRNESQIIDPTISAKSSATLIEGLKQKLAQSEAEMKVLRGYLNETSPKVKVLQSEIDALKTQISEQQLLLGSGRSGSGEAPANLSANIAKFEELVLEKEFAEKAYIGALASKQKAIADASANQRYLAIVQAPSIAQKSEHPKRWLWVMVVFLFSFLFWSITCLGIRNIRDRK